MRYILGLCAVLAIGNSAWTSEMGTIAGEPGYQTPAATATSSVTQATGTPTATAASPAGVYQAATAQPATTTASPRRPRCLREHTPWGLSQSQPTRHPWRTRCIPPMGIRRIRPIPIR